jgi:hypothetical protein
MIVIIGLLAFLGTMLIMAGLTSTSPADVLKNWTGAAL